MYEDLIIKYKEFDLKSALDELNRWQDELEDTYKGEIVRNVLMGVRDLILDNCIFE